MECFKKAGETEDGIYFRCKSSDFYQIRVFVPVKTYHFQLSGLAFTSYKNCLFPTPKVLFPTIRSEISFSLIFSTYCTLFCTLQYRNTLFTDSVCSSSSLLQLSASNGFQI